MPIKKIVLCAVALAATAAGGLFLVIGPPAQAAFVSSVGGPITRSEVIERAQYWVDHQPGPYSQVSYSPDPTGSRNYRRDCSGYVDMAWHTDSDNWTGNMSDISFQISRSDLRAGDILNDPVNHVMLFNACESDGVHFSYYSFGSTPVKEITHASIYAPTLDGHPNGNYIARRYNKIIDATTIAAPTDNLFGLSPDRAHVSVYSGGGAGPGAWTSIGGVATRLYAGGAGLFATNPNDGSVSKYNGDGTWTRIGGPADSFAVTGNALYGLSSDKTAVSVWNGVPGSWTVIGGAATRLYGGGAGLFATNPNDGSVNKYNGSPGSWTRIGGPGNSFAVGSTRLYGLAPDKSSVLVWSGSGTGWIGIGGPADSIAAN